MAVITSIPHELTDIPREPVGLLTDEGRRRVAQVIVWGGSQDKFYDRIQIQARVEALLAKIAKGIEEGKYGR